MTYDPYQTQSGFGAYPGLPTPFQSPSLNPLGSLGPMAMAYPHPHLAQILAARAAQQLPPASPWSAGLNNPLLALAVLQNPLLAATLENPLLNPTVAQPPFGAQPYPFNPYAGQIAPQFGQIGSPYGQIGSMLPPQSWVGQPGFYGSHPAAGQVHPLISQLLGRGFPGAGMFPTGF